jgi:hypothetical protein
MPRPDLWSGKCFHLRFHPHGSRYKQRCGRAIGPNTVIVIVPRIKSTVIRQYRAQNIAFTIWFGSIRSVGITGSLWLVEVNNGSIAGVTIANEPRSRDWTLKWEVDQTIQWFPQQHDQSMIPVLRFDQIDDRMAQWPSKTCRNSGGNRWQC